MCEAEHVRLQKQKDDLVITVSAHLHPLPVCHIQCVYLSPN
jgi:hypothetical protein